MDAVDVVIAAPPPTPPVPVPVVRISRLALAAADAVVCLWIVSMWCLPASVAAVILGLLACGSGCTCTDAAYTAFVVSLFFFVIVCPCAALKVSKFDDYIDQLEKAADAVEPISAAVGKAHLIAITAFASLEFFGILLKLMAINDPPTSRIASTIMVLLPLGICIMCCLLSVPVLAVRLWRIRRHSQASVVPI